MDVTMPAVKPTVVYFNNSDGSQRIERNQGHLKNIFEAKAVLLFDFTKSGKFLLKSNETQDGWNDRYFKYICEQIKLIYEVQSPSSQCNMILVTHGNATKTVKLVLEKLKEYRKCFTVLNLGGPLLVPNELASSVVNYIPPDSDIHKAYSRCVKVALLVKDGKSLEAAAKEAQTKNAERWLAERYNRYTIVILDRALDKEISSRSVRRYKKVLTKAPECH